MASSSEDALLERVSKNIRQRQLMAQGERLLVGVSGGVDSIVLLHMLSCLSQAFKFSLRAVHIDHQLRESAHEDARFVAQVCADWSVPLSVGTCDVREHCKRTGDTLEAGARKLRYGLFMDTASQYGIDKICVAHTADDQAETVLLRLIRGTGLSGLQAMQWSRPIRREPPQPFAGLVVRPLLDLWREELEAYLAEQQLPHRHDASNDDMQFTRNRIRHQLIPLLEADYNANIRRRLFQLAEQVQLDCVIIRQQTDRFWKRVLHKQQPRQVVLSVPALLRQDTAMQRLLVRRAIQEVHGELTGFEFRHWIEIENMLTGRPEGSVVDLPGGPQLVLGKQILTVK